GSGASGRNLARMRLCRSEPFHALLLRLDARQPRALAAEDRAGVRGGARARTDGEVARGEGQPLAGVYLETRLEIGLVEAELARLLERVRAQARRAVLADDLPVRALVDVLEREQFLGHDHVAFHADPLGDVGRAARAVAQALDLHDKVDRFRDLAADGFLRDLDVTHQDHVLHTAEALARAVGVERTHRTV